MTLSESTKNRIFIGGLVAILLLVLLAWKLDAASARHPIAIQPTPQTPCTIADFERVLSEVARTR